MILRIPSIFLQKVLNIYTNTTPTKYSATFYPNGGTGAPSNQTKTKGTALTLSTVKPTKKNYTFVNWNTKADGTGTSYASGATYSADTNVTLYTQYEKELNDAEEKYTITFYMNDGTGKEIEENSKTGDILILIAWITGIGALSYTVYYFKIRKETI